MRILVLLLGICIFAPLVGITLRWESVFFRWLFGLPAPAAIIVIIAMIVVGWLLTKLVEKLWSMLRK